MKLQRYRSLLFMPGNNPGMLTGAGALGADVVIFDLEDAVAQPEKDAARILVRRALLDMRPTNVECVVRINGLDTPYWQEDVAAAVSGGADIILLPKCESPEDFEQIQAVTGEQRANELPELMALVETAKGVENVSRITAWQGSLVGVMLGGEDFTADLGARRTPKGDELFYARSRILTACKAVRIKAIDSPFPFVADLEGLAQDADFAAQMGFDGKAVISPHHVHRVNEAFSPSLDQVEWATRVLVAAETAKKEGKGAIALDGMMVDLPIILRAERILSLAGK